MHQSVPGDHTMRVVYYVVSNELVKVGSIGFKLSSPFSSGPSLTTTNAVFIFAAIQQEQILTRTLLGQSIWSVGYSGKLDPAENLP